jgi:hypothetical protein
MCKEEFIFVITKYALLLAKYYSDDQTEKNEQIKKGKAIYKCFYFASICCRNIIKEIAYIFRISY